MHVWCVRSAHAEATSGFAFLPEPLTFTGLSLPWWKQLSLEVSAATTMVCHVWCIHVSHGLLLPLAATAPLRHAYLSGDTCQRHAEITPT